MITTIQLVTMFVVSFDEYIFLDKEVKKSSVRRRLDAELDKLNDKELSVRCVQLRKHSKAREKRYSFGYAVSFIFACYQILWTFPKSRYLCSRYLPLACG